MELIIEEKFLMLVVKKNGIYYFVLNGRCLFNFVYMVSCMSNIKLLLMIKLF